MSRDDEKTDFNKEWRTDSRRIYLQNTESENKIPLTDLARSPPGSIELEDIVKGVVHMLEDEFLDKFRHPFLVQSHRSKVDMPEDPGMDTVYGDTGGLPIMAVDSCLVYPLVKRGVNAFADMITVGRTLNNDLVIPHPMISKFHGYFRCIKGQWCVRDANSKNKTFVHDIVVSPSSDFRVIDKSLISFSPQVGFLFFLPETFYKAVVLNHPK